MINSKSSYKVAPSRRRRGATLLEFALVVPVLMLILLGIMEFGWLTHNQLVVANAAREGARLAAVGKPTATIQARIINQAKPVTVTNDDIKLESALQPVPASNDPAWGSWPPDDATASPSENGVKSGNLVRITVTLNHHALTGLPGFNNRVINASVSMVRE
jgi:Flp pilus assembly protein TadG